MNTFFMNIYGDKKAQNYASLVWPSHYSLSFTTNLKWQRSTEIEQAIKLELHENKKEIIYVDTTTNKMLYGYTLI